MNPALRFLLLVAVSAALYFLQMQVGWNPPPIASLTGGVGLLIGWIGRRPARIRRMAIGLVLGLLAGAALHVWVHHAEDRLFPIDVEHFAIDLGESLLIIALTVGLPLLLFGRTAKAPS